MLPIKSAKLFLDAIIFRYSIIGKPFNKRLECRLFAYFAVEFNCISNFIQFQVVDCVSNFSAHISQLLGSILMNFPFSLSFSVSRCMGWCRRINSKNVSRNANFQTLVDFQITRNWIYNSNILSICIYAYTESIYPSVSREKETIGSRNASLHTHINLERSVRQTSNLLIITSSLN